jgi:alpha-1,6-mannosyltransferase
MKNNNRILFLILLLIISEIAYLFIYSDLTSPIVLYAIVSIFNSFLFVIIWLAIKKIELKNWVLIFIFISGLVFRLSLLSVSPIASDDIYRYMWDGKAIANGINPYKYSANDAELNSLHSEILPKKINHAEMQTIYPPYSQLMFYAAYKIFGENVYGIKIILLLAELISLYLLYLLLKVQKLPKRNLALYALCPLPIMQFMIDGHIDGTGFPLLLLFLFFYLTGKKIKSFIMIGLSIISKFISGIVLPFALKEEKWKNRFLIIIIPVIIFALSYLPFISKNVFPFNSLIQFSSNWVANSSIFAVIFQIVKNNQDARQISLILFVISAGVLYFSKKEFVEKVYLIFILFFLFSPTVHIWYITWIAILLPLCFRWSGLAFICLVNLVNILMIEYVLHGVWLTFSWIHVIEYVPVISIFIWEIFRGRKRLVASQIPSG